MKIEARDLSDHSSLSNELDVVTAEFSPVRTNTRLWVLDATTAPNLTVTPDQLSYTLTSLSMLPQVGDLLVSGEGDGFLRRVLSVSRTGTQVTVQTANAALNEAFSDFSLSSTTRLLDLDQTSVPAAARAAKLPVREQAGVTSVHWPQTGITLSSEPLSPAPRKAGARAATTCLGTGTSTFKEDVPLKVTYPRSLCVEPGHELRFDINVEIEPSQAARFQITQLLFLGLTHPAIPAAVPSYGAQWALQPAGDTSGKGTLSWSPTDAHVDGKLRPYTAKFVALAKEREPCVGGIGAVGICQQRQVPVDVYIAVTWGDLPEPANYQFQADAELQLIATAAVDFQPEIQGDFQLRQGGLDFWTAVQGPVSFSTSVEAIATGHAQAHGSKELLRKKFLTIYPVGGVPVVLSGTFILGVEFNATADAALDLKQTLTLGADVLAGVQYTGAGGWQVQQQASPWQRYELSGEANGRAYLDLRFVPELDISLYGVATSKIIVEPYLYAEAALEGHFLYNYLADQSGVETDTDADYRFTKLEYGVGLDAKIWAGVDAFDTTLVGYPSRDPNNPATITLIDRTPVQGLPVLKPQQGPHTNAGEDTELSATYTNLPNPFYPLFSDQETLNPFVEASAGWKTIPQSSIATIIPAGRPLSAWLHSDQSGQYQVRFSGHSAMGSFIRQYEQINVLHDKPGIILTPTEGLVTTEAGATASFTIALSRQPTADVSIGLASSDTTEGTVSPATVVFTPTGWATPKTVTVTGVSDDLVDGDVAYNIITAPVVSADLQYQGRDPADVAVTNQDALPEIRVNPTSGLVTTEAGGTATFTLVLTRQPSADVAIGLTSSDTTEGTVAPALVTFTPANWAAPQTVTVTGVDDNLVDGNVAYQIMTAPAVSADARYHGLDSEDVPVINQDDEAPLPGGITRVSVASDGTQANGPSFLYGITADGRYVTFHSRASNLVAGNPSNPEGLYVHDRQTGVTDLISDSPTRVDSPSCKGIGMGRPFSLDGSTGVAVTWPSQWVTRFVAVDCRTGATRTILTGDSAWPSENASLVPQGPDGTPTQILGMSHRLVISGNGRYAAMLPYTDGYGGYSLLVDLQSEEIKVTEYFTHDGPTSMSDDGRYLVYYSFGGYFPWPSRSAVFDRTSGVSRPILKDGLPYVNGDVVAIDVYVGVESEIPGGEGRNIFTYDLTTDETRRISIAPDGTAANGYSHVSGISPSGRFVAFQSEASNLVPGGTNGPNNLFVLDRQTGTISHASKLDRDPGMNDWDYFHYQEVPRAVFSADGRYLAFTSYSPDLVPGDTNGTADVYPSHSGFR